MSVISLQSPIHSSIALIARQGVIKSASTQIGFPGLGLRTTAPGYREQYNLISVWNPLFYVSTAKGGHISQFRNRDPREFSGLNRPMGNRSRELTVCTQRGAHQRSEKQLCLDFPPRRLPCISLFALQGDSPPPGSNLLDLYYATPIVFL